MSIDETDAELIAKEEAMERNGGDIAMNHLRVYPPFSTAPETAGLRFLPDYEEIAKAQQLTKAELLELVAKDLPKYFKKFRAQVLNVTHIGDVRMGVLTGVAFVISPDAVLEIKELWVALKEERYNEAANLLLMSRWPTTGTKPAEQKRILELADMMRFGVPPTPQRH